MVDFPGRVIDLVSFAPILSEVLCSMNWTMHLREKVVNDVVLQRAPHLVDVAFVASIEVTENNLNMGLWRHN
jgi:hypothetical protein